MTSTFTFSKKSGPVWYLSFFFLLVVSVSHGDVSLGVPSCIGASTAPSLEALEFFCTRRQSNSGSVCETFRVVISTMSSTVRACEFRWATVVRLTKQSEPKQSRRCIEQILSCLTEIIMRKTLRVWRLEKPACVSPFTRYCTWAPQRCGAKWHR